MKSRLIAFIRRSLPTRLSLWIVLFVASLFTATLVVMFLFARQAVKNEALEKAQATLDNAVQNIDNTLHRVETAMNNMRLYMEHHLDSPDAIENLCRMTLDANPAIEGCSMAFMPGYYPSKDSLFLIYRYRDGANTLDDILSSNFYNGHPYPEQDWFKYTVAEEQPCWTVLTMGNMQNGHSIASYNLPIHDSKGRTVAVMSCDISLEWLSHTIQSTQPFPNTYCSLMSNNGTFIIHPDSTLLTTGALFRLLEAHPDEQLNKLGHAMLNGETGYMEARHFGTDCYIFYKPYKSAGWSINIVCPKNEIFARYYRMLRIMTIVSMASLMLILLLCRLFIGRQLKPLNQLDASVRRLTEGHFNETLPVSTRIDEIGNLERDFRTMQKSIVAHIEEINRRSTLLNNQNEALSLARDHALEADRVKNAFLHNMTDQMTSPVKNITKQVAILHEEYSHLRQDKIADITEILDTQTTALVQQLNSMLKVSVNKSISS